MSCYLELAKKVVVQPPTAVTEKELMQRQRRKLKEAERRGLVVRWSEYPDWLILHDPLTSEWHEVWASDCLPSLVEEANKRQKRQITKKTKHTKDGTSA